jgi:hypothetical protein
MHAARENNKEAVQLLIYSGAQIDVVNHEEMGASEVTLDAEIDSKIKRTKDKKL